MDVTWRGFQKRVVTSRTTVTYESNKETLAFLTYLNSCHRAYASIPQGLQEFRLALRSVDSHVSKDRRFAVKNEM
jgi:hypothetical protein